jgi:hypothetical protein
MSTVVPPVVTRLYAATVAGLFYPFAVGYFLFSRWSPDFAIWLFIGPFALVPAIVLFPIFMMVRRNRLSAIASIAHTLGSILIFVAPGTVFFCIIGGALVGGDTRSALFLLPYFIIPYPSVAILIGCDLFFARFKSEKSSSG